MITLEAIQTALLASDPYAQMDRIVRAEMAAGRKVQEIFDDIEPLSDSALDRPGMTVDSEEAFLGTLDALTGMCHRDCRYIDPPVSEHNRPTLPVPASDTQSAPLV